MVSNQGLLSAVVGLILLMVPKNFGDLDRFKAAEMDGASWASYIFMSIPSNILTQLSCATKCINLDSANCELFHLDKEAGLCHIGRIANTETSFLPAPSGTASIFFDSTVLTTMIEDEYYILVEILDETHWEKHLFTSTVVAPNDVLGCSSACKTATSPTCDFFVLKGNTCHLGNGAHTTGDVSQVLGQSDVYVLKTNIANVAPQITYGSSEILPSWANKIRDWWTDVNDAAECRGYCKFEGCEFYVYDAGIKECLLGYDGHNDPDPVVATFTNPSEFGINAEQIDAAPLSSSYLTEPTGFEFYGRFIYQVISGPISYDGCIVHCHWDPMSKCELHIWINGTDEDHCALGRFDHTGGNPPNKAGIWTAYILKIAGSDPSGLFSSPSVTVTKSEVVSHSVVKLESSNALECSQHTVLRFGDQHNYGQGYVMVGSDCYIAVFGQGTMTEVDVGTDNVEVKMHAAAITKFKNAYYHTQYIDFTEDIVKYYIFKTIDLTGSQDIYSCTAFCELSLISCHFFVFETTKCHLGNLEDNTRTVVTTTLNSGFYPKYGYQVFNDALYSGNFYGWPTNPVWDQFVARDKGAVKDFYQCGLLCHHDPTCQFMFQKSGACYHGDFSTNSPPAGVPALTGNTWIKRNNDIVLTGIDSLFDAKVGDVSQSNGLMESYYWEFEMTTYAHTLATKEHCMLRCALLYTWCHMTFMKDPTDTYCFFGGFNRKRSNNVVGSRADDSSTFYIRNDLDFGTIMSDSMGTNCASCTACLNSGYHTLTTANEKVDFTSNNHPTGYSNDEECYWGIYASGATQIKVVIEEADTNDAGDGINIFMGLSVEAQVYNIDYEIGNNLINTTTTYILNTEFMVMKWFSDGSGTSSGMKGYIERLG